jgi:hypothetical protein
VAEEADEQPAAASPHSTGGGGTRLEHRLGTVFLTRLLTAGPVFELGERVPDRVAFQQSPATEVDDLVITARAADGVASIRLEAAATKAWGGGQADAVDWRERLQSQLRDGSFHYIAVAQPFTRPVLKNSRVPKRDDEAARFSAVELVRFSAEGYGAFEARFVAGAGPSATSAAGSRASLAGIDDFVESVTDDDYRHVLQDLFRGVRQD